MHNDIMPEKLLLLIILILGVLFRLYVSHFIITINLISLIVSVSNMILIFYILRRLFGKTSALLTILFYSICPWMVYLEAANYFYSALLLAALLLFLGLILYKQGNKHFGVISIVVSLVSLLFVIANNQMKADLYSDPGLLNSVNAFQGELRESGVYNFGKLIENRYIFSTLHLLFNVLKQFSPATYFSSQEKLLGFSFSPPMYAGLLIPFIFGLPIFLGFIKKYPLFLIVIAIFFMPSVLSGNSPDIARLSLVSPFMFLTVGLGYQTLFSSRKNKIWGFLMVLSIALVILQMLELMIEIPTLEPLRMMKL